MAKTTIPIELSSTPSIVDGGNATAITIDSSENVTFAGGLVIPSTITHAGDTDTKLDFNQANTLRLITGDNTAWICNASSMVINEDSIDFDFRVESNGNANMLFVDGGNDRVGINGTGTNARGGSNTVAVFDVSGSGKNYVEIQGATDSTANGLLFSDGSSGNYGVVGYNHASDNMNFFTAGSERMRITGSGAFFLHNIIGFSGANSDVRYDTSSGQIYYQTSSQRYKSEITNLEDSLNKIQSLRPVRFKDNHTEKFTIGLIAEEVVDIIPEVVFKKDIDGFDEQQPEGINYSDITPFLIKAIQEQQTVIEDLKSRIETLEG